ncbi:MAG: hypothetical protein AAF909_03395 [Pseudomonadota bacterium]
MSAAADLNSSGALCQSRRGYQDGPSFDAGHWLDAKHPASRVLHCIQGKKRRVLAFVEEISPDDNVLAILYDEPVSDDESRALQRGADGRRAFLYWPCSTWAEGRNFGRDIALLGADAFDYVAFLDDDVVFTRGAYTPFIDDVARHRALIATPITYRADQSRYTLPTARQAAALNDEQLLVFHISVVKDAEIWPIDRTFENESWHIACLIQQYFLTQRFPRQLIQFNDYCISNEGHEWLEADGASNYKYEQNFSRVVRLAHERVSERLGRPAPKANESFRRMPTRNPLELLQIFAWKRVFRPIYMRYPLDRDGGSLELGARRA